MTPEKKATKKILGLRMESDGLMVSLSCSDCGQMFETYLPTIAGVAIGCHLCPGCQKTIEVWPEEVGELIEQFIPDQDLEALNELTTEATRIVESWYRIEPLAKHLRYKGINLGQGVERELMAIVLDGLRMASSKPIKDNRDS